MAKQMGAETGLCRRDFARVTFDRQCSLDFFFDFQNLIGGHIPQ